MNKSVVRLWWGDKNRNDHRKKNRLLMEQTLRLVMNDKHQVPFVTYVCGQDNYDYLKSEGLENLSLVTKNPRLDIPVEIDAQHRLYLCDIAMKDFNEIICVNWDCRLVNPFTDNVWTILRKKEPLQAALICSKRRKAYKLPMVHTRGEDGHIFALDGFLYLRDPTLPQNILKLLDDPEIKNKWTPEALVSTYIDYINGKWIGLQKYYELYEPDCFFGGRLSVWKHATKKKNIVFAWQRYFKTLVDVSAK